MKIKDRINIGRKAIMGNLTKNIGRSAPYNLAVMETVVIKKILVVRPNARLGNQLLLTPLLQEITKTFPDCYIDVLVKGNLAPLLFKNYKNIGQIIKLPQRPFNKPFTYIYKWICLKFTHYDIVINAVNNSASGKLMTKLAWSHYKFFGYQHHYPLSDDSLKHMAKIPVFDFRNCINRLGFEYNTASVPDLDIKLDQTEINHGQAQLKKLVQNQKQTICLFTYATGQKCYSAVWWLKFYGKLSKEHSHYNFIEILPATNKSNIDNIIPVYYSDNVREIAAVIANCTLFIGADSGIMHLASASGIPTAGLFSCTDMEVYKPYNKNSIALNTNAITIEECVSIIQKRLKSAASFQNMDDYIVKKKEKQLLATCKIRSIIPTGGTRDPK
ncbi:glycosyltransferase family 9 protein [Flavobacterium sp. ACN6]|uniref:glycosyltransferase family 9 protein n=1 Tax=Flavobacterium sp. ACN6 TaxID=1920426 RepID=UPI000BB34119|nr:glycosyltransferase family 9 protein [Flavobacterium sp. ACN6]PBJ08088.1 Lipopolysaccharide core heptosyltransferase RfaQ [Flavobacterium sp. ACN6]